MGGASGSTHRDPAPTFEVIRFLHDDGIVWMRRLVVAILVIGPVSFLAAAFDFPGSGLLERFSGLTTTRSIATWLTAVLLFSIGLLALLAGVVDRSRRRGWRLISFASILLSAEEIVGLHEIREHVARTPTDRPPSVISLIAALAIAALGFAVLTPFLRSLPSQIAMRMVGAGLLMVVGAIALQFVGALTEIERGSDSLAFVAIHTMEEFFELMGFAVFASAVVRHLISLESPPGRGASPTATDQPPM